MSNGPAPPGEDGRRHRPKPVDEVHGREVVEVPLAEVDTRLNALLVQRGLDEEQAATFHVIVNGGRIMRRLAAGRSPQEIAKEIYPKAADDADELSRRVLYIAQLKEGAAPWAGIPEKELERIYLPAIKEADRRGLVEKGLGEWLDNEYSIGENLVERCGFGDAESRINFMNLGTDITDPDLENRLELGFWSSIAEPLANYISTQPNPDEKFGIFKELVDRLPPDERPRLYTDLGMHTPRPESTSGPVRNRALEALIELNPDEATFGRFMSRVVRERDSRYFQDNDVETIVKAFQPTS